MAYYIEDLLGVLETVLQPDALERVKSSLSDGASELDRGEFQNLKISESVFGGSETGAELGFHHGKAHQIVSDTIEGVIVDLRDFRQGLIQAESMLTEADAGAGDRLAMHQAAVGELVNANSFFAGDARNRDSRNEHLSGGEGA